MSVAIASRIGGVFTNTFGPMFMLPMSSEQISGRRSSTCCTRWRGVRSVVPGPGFIGSSALGREAPAGAGGQVDDDVGAARADAVDHLGVERALHARQPGLRVAHMDMHDRGAGLGGIDRRGRRSAPASPARPGSSRRVRRSRSPHRKSSPCVARPVLPELRFRLSLQRSARSRDTGSPCMTTQRSPCHSLCAALSHGNPFLERIRTENQARFHRS